MECLVEITLDFFAVNGCSAIPASLCCFSIIGVLTQRTQNTQNADGYQGEAEALRSKG